MTTIHMVIETETLEATMVETIHPQTIPAAVPTGGETTKNLHRQQLLFVIQNNFHYHIFIIKTATKDLVQ